MRRLPAIAVASAALLLAGCGGGGGGFSFSGGSSTGSTARGSVVTLPPPVVASLSASDLTILLIANTTGQQLKQLAGTPVCGIDVRYLTYRTIGGQGEATTATAAVMVPTGTNPSCNGTRPIVLYAHGTATARAYNIANWVNVNQPAAAEGSLVAAFFAAQGFIVVAPNYAGYDTSPLPYHPYLNGNQQGKDMADALTAARTALPTVGVATGGSLLVAGYSQGGYVALAALRELQSVGTSVTAVAPMSAPSAISLLIDYSFSGWPALGATVFTPFITTSWQNEFGNVYTATTDIYSTQYANGIATLLPSLSPDTLFSSGAPPQLALFPANGVPGPVNPSLSIFYGSGNLVTQA
ncbi:MAG TPA: alpha/beta fold hydrolase, partial [Variovorax sp.]